MTSKIKSISIIAAACAMVSVSPRTEYYGSSYYSTPWGWGGYHVDYQFGEHPKVQAKLSIKKGYHLNAQQERRKALYKRHTQKTKAAKGKRSV